MVIKRSWNRDRTGWPMRTLGRDVAIWKNGGGGGGEGGDGSISLLWSMPMQGGI